MGAWFVSVGPTKAAVSPLRSWAHCSPKGQGQGTTSPWLEQLPPPPPRLTERAPLQGHRAPSLICPTGDPTLGQTCMGQTDGRGLPDRGTWGLCPGWGALGGGGRQGRGLRRDFWPHAPCSGRKCFISPPCVAPPGGSPRSSRGAGLPGPWRAHHTRSELGRLPAGPLQVLCPLCGHHALSSLDSRCPLMRRLRQAAPPLSPVSAGPPAARPLPASAWGNPSVGFLSRCSSCWPEPTPTSTP